MLNSRVVIACLGVVPALFFLFLSALDIGGDVIRGAFAAVLVVTFPGILLAPLFRSFQGPAWDRSAFVLLSFLLSVGVGILNFTVIKLLGFEVGALPLVGLSFVEGGLSTVFWWKRPLRFEAVSKGGPIALAIIFFMVLGWSVTHWALVLQELDRQYYDPIPMVGQYEGAEHWEERGVETSLIWTDGEHKTTGILTGKNGGTEPADFRIFLLLHGPIDSTVDLACGEETRSATIQRDVIEMAEEGSVPRYMDAGVATVSIPVNIEVGSEFECSLQLSGSQSEMELIDLSGLPDWGFYELDRTHGYVLTHYYQLLNIVENIRWADELRSSRWLTINQPPLWSYVYASIVVYGGVGLIPLHVFFAGLIFALGALIFRVIQEEHPDLPGYFAIPVSLFALSHLYIIQSSGSENFPDNLYAFALLALFFGLNKRQSWLYVVFGVMASFLRYPGSVVAILAALAVFLMDRGRRATAKKGGSIFLGMLLLPCVLLGLGALATGQLQQWLEILWFETFPEHFHGNYDVGELLARAPEFYGLWLTYAGFTPLLLLGGLRGTVPKSAALLALAYSPFLCFIDHFPSHYFLPLLVLSGVAVVGSVAHWGPKGRIAGLVVVTLMMGRWLVFGVV